MGQLGLGSGPHVVGWLESGMRVSASFQIIPRPMFRLESGMRVSASFQIISRPVG